jgi:hypothetical protein
MFSISEAGKPTRAPREIWLLCRLLPLLYRLKIPHGAGFPQASVQSRIKVVPIKQII